MSNETGDLTVPLETADLEGLKSPSVKQGAKDTVSSLKAAAGAAKETAAAAASHAKETGEAWREQAGVAAGQAVESARAAATSVKDRTGTALHSLSKLIADTAETVDGKLGPQYGDYARQAAESVAGAAQSLDEKDIDQLVSDARDFVRKSPAVAIGAAALVGFVLMRLARGGSKES
ncbi:hypothetical protein LWE61_14655 [Sphingobium sufflavum]|uniref:hypothetical protein n=1 Tax=Sphingobium sufflavum TaxID=1129547 RepID=UPI001F2DDC09|nr:hypothetical protein [Sphingobium sufflavum]MCE7797789.1 hypothetical protein [Sphingobium sufflavum]